MGQKQVNKSDPEFRVKAINEAQMAGRDIGQFSHKSLNNIHKNMYITE